MAEVAAEIVMVILPCHDGELSNFEKNVSVAWLRNITRPHAFLTGLLSQINCP